MQQKFPNSPRFKVLALKICLTLVILCSIWGCHGAPEIILDESLPVTEASESISEDVVGVVPESGAETLASGDFQNAAHKVSGRALLVSVAGKPYLRLENFKTENGPDLHLYVIQNDSGSPLGDDFADLGILKSTRGNLNYPIPEDLELSQQQSVSVWCKSFGVNFGFAPLISK